MKLAWCRNWQPGGLANSGSPALPKFVATAVAPPPYDLATTSSAYIWTAFLMAGSLHFTLPWYHLVYVSGPAVRSTRSSTQSVAAQPDAAGHPGGQDGVDVAGAGVLHLRTRLLLPGRDHLQEGGLLVTAPGTDHADGLAADRVVGAAVAVPALGTGGGREDDNGQRNQAPQPSIHAHSSLVVHASHFWAPRRRNPNLADRPGFTPVSDRLRNATAVVFTRSAQGRPSAQVDEQHARESVAPQLFQTARRYPRFITVWMRSPSCRVRRSRET